MTNTTLNIDIFNESAALIFGELYKNFPVPICLNYNTLSARLSQDESFAGNEKTFDVLINTLSWLKTSGFLWLDSESEMDVYGVVLTPKGLEALKFIQQPENEITPIGEKLSNTETTREQRASLVGIALTEGNKLT